MDLIQNIILFGFPVMSVKIDQKSYNKKSIISTIEKNFKISPKRNSSKAQTGCFSATPLQFKPTQPS